jgi:hypothetical protein
MMSDGWRRLEINGGQIRNDVAWRFSLPAGVTGYADSQIDDYGAPNAFSHRADTAMRLRARFSHPVNELQGTAGFGFWNAPYGDPTSSRRLKLPRAAWFFYASPPNDLPFAPGYPGRGWFAATINAAIVPMLAIISFAPFALILNQFRSTRQTAWSAIQAGLGIHHSPLQVNMTGWHDYYLSWREEGCTFEVDGERVLETRLSPRGPMGFVCWLDNQYLILSPRGRIRAGVLSLPQEQWMEVAELRLGPH